MTKLKTITFADLERVLLTVGFAQVPTAGRHKVFRHGETDTVVLLPLVPAETALDDTHLVAVRKMVDERGVIAADVFDSMLRGEE
ncbi:MAG TPA: hypothetical protein VFW96_26285 [Thermomicrobiales bacterium]|nr:hypothetical protein [Thermomicrobiales bacterium]